MRKELVFLFVLPLVALLGIAPEAGSEPWIQATAREGAIEVSIDGKHFTTYLTPTDWKFPYLWPVNGPASGKTITIEEGIDYPHHRSLYFGCDKVNGCNFWAGENSTGQIKSLGPAIVESGTQVILEDTCEWVCPGKPTPILDRRRITIAAPTPDIRHIDFRFDLTFLENTHIAKTNHSLFSAEVVPELSVRGGGTLINAHGGLHEEGTFGKAAVWCDYSGKREGVREGLAILQHPENPDAPWPYFTRDYGFFSPTPLYWIGEEGLTIDKGEQITLRFLVVVHRGGAEDVDLNAIFREWTTK